jgi:hypothetical protein
MMSVGRHLRMIGRPGRIGALDATLRHVNRSDVACIAARAAIARDWLGIFPEAAQ